MSAQGAEFRFTIKYQGDKASRLISGELSHSQICSVFKQDLTALGVNHPKTDKIKQDSFGGIYFTYYLDRHNDCQHRRYQTVETTQYRDPDIFTVKSNRSIQYITTILEKNALTSTPAQAIQASKSSNAKRTYPSASTSSIESVSPGSPGSSLGRASKRRRLIDESAEPAFQESTDRPLLNIDSSISVITDCETPATSPQIPIKVEQEEAPAIAPSNSSNSTPLRPAKTIICLNAKPVKAPLSSRPNPLVAYSRSQEVNKLSRELWDTRRILSAAQARESALVKELQQLTHLNLGECNGVVDNQEQLRELKTRLNSSETELESERRRRVLAEQCLKDVERECRDPFVVPALLKAFINISQITGGGGGACC